MTDPTITCPNCGEDIKLTESLAAPLIAATKKEYETKLSERSADIAKREKAIGDQAKALEEAQNKLDGSVNLTV